ncbi:uncharacterized protein MONOS_8438 [Monocercomonoides exilis]|uniref:uncharacterized protein n=1 Tax=Monocercomonoides exilis TaxID=2049356 RepID=UPI003559DB91|nr:hypothetical protein MONOS_8438 [Monocercomonoides exilis]
MRKEMNVWRGEGRTAVEGGDEARGTVELFCEERKTFGTVSDVQNKINRKNDNGISLDSIDNETLTVDTNICRPAFSTSSFSTTPAIISFSTQSLSPSAASSNLPLLCLLATRTALTDIVTATLLLMVKKVLFHLISAILETKLAQKPSFSTSMFFSASLIQRLESSSSSSSFSSFSSFSSSSSSSSHPPSSSTHCSCLSSDGSTFLPHLHLFKVDVFLTAETLAELIYLVVQTKEMVSTMVGAVKMLMGEDEAENKEGEEGEEEGKEKKEAIQTNPFDEKALQTKETNENNLRSELSQNDASQSSSSSSSSFSSLLSHISFPLCSIGVSISSISFQMFFTFCTAIEAHADAAFLCVPLLPTLLSNVYLQPLFTGGIIRDEGDGGDGKEEGEEEGKGKEEGERERGEEREQKTNSISSIITNILFRSQSMTEHESSHGLPLVHLSRITAGLCKQQILQRSEESLWNRRSYTLYTTSPFSSINLSHPPLLVRNVPCSSLASRMADPSLAFVWGREGREGRERGKGEKEGRREDNSSSDVVNSVGNANIIQTLLSLTAVLHPFHTFDASAEHVLSSGGRYFSNEQSSTPSSFYAPSFSASYNSSSSYASSSDLASSSSTPQMQSLHPHSHHHSSSSQHSPPPPPPPPHPEISSADWQKDAMERAFLSAVQGWSPLEELKRREENAMQLFRMYEQTREKERGKNGRKGKNGREDGNKGSERANDGNCENVELKGNNEEGSQKSISEPLLTSATVSMKTAQISSKGNKNNRNMNNSSKNSFSTSTSSSSSSFSSSPSSSPSSSSSSSYCISSFFASS